MTSESAEYIVESDVTPMRLCELFAKASYRTRLDDDGDIFVQAEPISVYVSINEDNKLIRYTAYCRIDESTSLGSKHAFVNKMNDKVVFCRFSVPDTYDDTVVADYYLPFGERVSSLQVISSLRIFAHIVPSAIHDIDHNNLIK